MEVLTDVKVQMEYLLILFTSDGKMEHEVDWQFGTASAAMQRIVMKRVEEGKGLDLPVNLCFNPMVINY